MQIIITLKDTTHKAITTLNTISEHLQAEVVRAIKNGTELPKGHWMDDDTLDSACSGYMSTGVKCSNCGATFCGYMKDCDYCPICGAEIGEVDKEIQNG